MRWPTLKCPFCGGILPNTEVWPNRPLTCPTCSRQLQLEKRQGYFSALIALGLTVLLAYFSGLRGFWLIGASALLWFPVFLVWEFIFARIVPTRFEPYGGRNADQNDAGHRLLGK